MSLEDLHHMVQSYNTMVPQQPPGGIGTAGYVPALPALGIPALQANDAGIGRAQLSRWQRQEWAAHVGTR